MSKSQKNGANMFLLLLGNILLFLKDVHNYFEVHS